MRKPIATLVAAAAVLGVGAPAVARTIRVSVESSENLTPTVAASAAQRIAGRQCAHRRGAAAPPVVIWTPSAPFRSTYRCAQVVPATTTTTTATTRPVPPVVAYGGAGDELIVLTPSSGPSVVAVDHTGAGRFSVVGVDSDFQ